MSNQQYKELDDPEWIREKHHEQHLNQYEIAQELGCSQGAVSYAMRKFNIQVIQHQGQHKEPEDMWFYELIAGELLGDGSIQNEYPDTPYARYSHTTKYELYAQWLVDMIESAGLDAMYYENGNQYNVQTLSYSCLYDIWQEWYSSDGREVPNGIQLTPTVLRQWYIGDGTRRSREGKEPYVVLTNRSFSEGSISLLQKSLSHIGIDSSQHDDGMYIPVDKHDRFFQYMSDLPEQLDDIYGYKWPRGGE